MRHLGPVALCNRAECGLMRMRVVGGPEALTGVLRDLPVDLPMAVVVQQYFDARSVALGRALH
jgi:hypothetical protein